MFNRTKFAFIFKAHFLTTCAYWINTHQQKYMKQASYIKEPMSKLYCDCDRVLNCHNGMFKIKMQDAEATCKHNKNKN